MVRNATPVSRSSETGIDPRVEKSRASALEAAIELLIEKGYKDATLKAISERSRLARTTLYRHWSSRQALLADAFGQLTGEATVVETGNLVEDLEAALTLFARSLDESRWASVLASLIEAAERDEGLRRLSRRLTAERRRPLRQVLGLAQARGELPASEDTDVMVELLVAPLFYRRLVSREPLSDNFLHAVVAHFLP